MWRWSWITEGTEARPHRTPEGTEPFRPAAGWEEKRDQRGDGSPSTQTLRIAQSSSSPGRRLGGEAGSQRAQRPVHPTPRKAQSPSAPPQIGRESWIKEGTEARQPKPYGLHRVLPLPAAGWEVRLDHRGHRGPSTRHPGRHRTLPTRPQVGRKSGIGEVQG